VPYATLFCSIPECWSDRTTPLGTVIPSEAPWHRMCLNLDAFRCVPSEGGVADLDFCRWDCVTGMCETAMYDRISYENSTEYMKATLSRSVRGYVWRGVPEAISQRYALMSAFDVSWNEGQRLLHLIIGNDGMFSHNYSLEETLFIVHMHVTPPSFLGQWFKGSSYHEEQVTYSGCLTAAIARGLSSYGRLKDFHFDMPTESTRSREELVNININKLLDASGASRAYDEYVARARSRSRG